jgi:fructose-bisphosphate aldolase class II
MRWLETAIDVDVRWYQLKSLHAQTIIAYYWTVVSSVISRSIRALFYHPQILSEIRFPTHIRDPRVVRKINMSTSTPTWKDQNRHIQILKAAEAGKYGVIAAIAYNIEQIIGLVRAAERARSPLIIQFFPWAVELADGLLVRTAADAARRASVPISVHLDHAQSEAIIKRAADTLPFDSIMGAMSHHEKEVNLAKTAEWVKYCNERQIATEAEPGRIEGGEDGVMDTEGLEACKTTPEEAAQFVATGVDALAPAFGNVHGEYGPVGPQLDFEKYLSPLLLLVL